MAHIEIDRDNTDIMPSPISGSSLPAAPAIPVASAGSQPAGPTAPPHSLSRQRDNRPPALAAVSRHHDPVREPSEAETSAGISPAAAGFVASQVADWTGQRKREFGHLLREMNQTRARPIGGRAFLRYLASRCDEEAKQGRGTPVHENMIVEFDIDIDTRHGKQVVKVWRLIAWSGIAFLRMAPPQSDVKARDMLIRNMLIGARRSNASSQGADPAISHAVFPYGRKDARMYWSSCKEREFEGVLERWNAATGQQRSGTELLRHMSALCDQRLVIPMFRQIDPQGQVLEFEIGIEGAGEIKVWRLVDEDGGIMLRRAPLRPGHTNWLEAGSLGSEEERLLENMFLQVRRKASRKQNLQRIIGSVVFSWRSSDAQREWSSVGGSFKLEHERWNAVHGASYSGAVFLQHMSALCDEQLALENATQVDESGYIFEFKIEVRGVGEIDVWRLMDTMGTVCLCKAPPLQDDDQPAYEKARMAQQESMRERAKRRSGIVDDVPLTPFGKEQANVLWKADCMRQLDPSLQAWKESCGRRHSGADFLIHISRLCDEQDLLERREVIDPECGIHAYRIHPYPGGSELWIWRLVPREGVVLLRLAPTPPDDRNDRNRVAEFKSRCEALTRDMRTAAATSRRARRNSSGAVAGNNEA